MSEFIFMLTVNDVTVSDALERYDEVRDLDLHWVGFKDIGLPVDTQRELVRRIRADGRKVALEIVSLDQASEVTSAAAAIDMGVDLMMGGVHPDAILPLLEHSNILYFPFAGRVEGHPSVLVGSVDEIGSSARQLSGRRGVHGLDLLAYRFSGDVPGLMTAVVDAALWPGRGRRQHRHPRAPAGRPRFRGVGVHGRQCRVRRHVRCAHRPREPRSSTCWRRRPVGSGTTCRGPIGDSVGGPES